MKLHEDVGRILPEDSTAGWVGYVAADQTPVCWSSDFDWALLYSTDIRDLTCTFVSYNTIRLASDLPERN